MNYEIERKLNDKVDKWELHNIRDENREQKNRISELERKIGELDGVNSNRYYLLETLLKLLAESEQLTDISAQLYELIHRL